MARITNSMLTSNYLNNISKNLSYIQKMQTQLSTGKEISKPSDDPYKTSRIIKMYADISNNEQYNDNITDVNNLLDITDTSLTQMSNLFSRVRELLVSAGNAAYGSEQRESIQDELKEKVNEFAQMLNTNFDGKYVFGGSKVDSKPVTVVDGKIQYADSNGNEIAAYRDTVTGKITSTKTDTSEAIDLRDDAIREEVENELSDLKNIEDSGVDLTDEQLARKKELEGIKEGIIQIKQIDADMKVEISQGVTINYNKTASEILEFTDPDDPTKTINVCDLLNDIINNLGEDGDESKLTGENLADLDKAISNILKKSSEIGAMQNRMESAKTQNETENYNLTDILSNVEDIDFTEKMIEFSTLLTVYTASLQISSNILPQTIMDYL